MSTAYANPNGFAVVNGQAIFNYNGNTLSVTNTPGSIINWQGFSIGANELTRFIQQSAASSVLNRVVGADPSRILGALQSNGRVFLINPSGILFGAGAQIDVAGLVASTLNLSNADFLAGRLRFTEVPGAGSIVNQGSITTPTGGQVYLIAPNVQNSGIITSPRGEVILAAGRSVQLVDAGTPGLRVELTAPDNEAVNVGQIMAASGKVGIYAGLIRAGGAIRADGVVAGENGEILLKATQSATIDAGATITANGAQGGKVTIQSGDTTLVSGTVEAKGSDGKGGTVQLLGHLVGVADNAVVDASGQAGGGTVLVGGDYQGRNPDVQNAYRTYVGPTAAINADAIASGNGGKVIVWSDDATRVYGSISARGGAQSGDGGFVETSGHRLEVTRGPDVAAPRGAAGTWLLDPIDLNVVPGFTIVNNTSAPVFSPLAESSSVGVELINAQLDFGSNVVLSTASQGPADGLQAGNITVSAPILKKAATTTGTGGIFIGTTSLTMQAHNNIVIDPSGSITSTGDRLDVTLAANNFSGTGNGGVTVGGAIITNGGFVDISGRGPIALNAPISTLRNTGTGSGNFISLSSSANAVNVAAAISSGTSFSADGFTGVSIGGPVTNLSGVGLFSSTGPIMVAAPVSGGFFDAETFGAGALLTLAAPVTSTGAFLLADNMDIQAALNAGSGGITVQQSLAGRPIDFGTNTPGSLSLTQTELSNLVTSGSKTFGNGSTGPFTVSAPVTVGSSQVSLQSGSSFTVNAGASLTTAVPLFLTAPAMAINSTVSASEIDVGSFGQPVSLGNGAGGGLHLDAAELANLSSNVLRINGSGAMTVQGPISRSGTLSLSGGTLGQSIGVGATITADSLGLNFGTVNLPEANAVTTLAGSVNNLTFANASLLTIGSVDGTNGMFTVTATLKTDDLNVANTFSGNTINIMPLTPGRTLNLGAADVAGQLNISAADLANIHGTTVNLSADTANIGGPVSASTSTSVLTIAPVTAARPLNIVGAKVGGALEFTPADIANVSATALTLGDSATGPVGINANPAAPNTIQVFVLRSGDTATGITVTAPLTVANSLGLIADAMALNNTVTATGGSVTITTNTAKPINLGSNPGVGTLGLDATELGQISTAGLFVGNSLATGMTVSAPVTLANAGTLNFDTGGTLAINAALTNTSAGRINLTANTMTVGAAVTGASDIEIGPISNSGIFLGSKSGGVLGLTAGELNLFAPGSGVLRIGNSSTAGIVVTAPIAPSGASILSLVNSGGGVGQNAGATITASNLAVQSNNGITLNGNNNISGSVALHSDFGAIDFKHVGGTALTVGTVDGVTGVTTFSGPITLQTDQLNINNGISAAFGSNNVSLLPVTTTLPIKLGVAAKVGGAMELTNPELNTIDASTLFVGNTSTGSITVAGAVNLSSFSAPSSLSLVTAPANTIVVNGGALTVPNGSLTLNTGTLTTTAAVSAGGSINATAGGTMNLGANFTAGSSNNLTANTLITGANVVSSFGSITAVAESMTFSGGPNSVSAVSGNITLRPSNASTVIDLGGLDVFSTTNTLGLDATDQAALAPAQLFIGGSSVPSITVSAATNLGAKPATLTTAAAGTIAVNNPLSTTSNLTLNADNITIPGGGSLSGANVALNSVNAGLVVDLGTLATGAFVLNQASLDRITTAGTLTLTAGTLNVPSAVTFTNAANLALRANTMDIASSVTTSGVGSVISVAPRTFSIVRLGGAGLSGGLELSNTEIGKFSSPTGVLRLGDTSTASSISIEGPISINPANVSALTLASDGSGIAQGAAGSGFTITAANLRLQSTGQINLPEANVVGTLAGGNTGSNYTFTNAGLLNVGAVVDGVSGLQGGTLNLKADDLALVGPGVISNSTATLGPRNAAAAMNLGASPGGVFGVDATELANITGSNLTFGNSTAGAVTVSAPMQRGTGSLGILTAPTQTVDVNGALSGPSGVQIDAGTINVLQPISSTSGSVTLTARAPTTLNINAQISAGSSVGLNSDVININAPVIANPNSGTVTIAPVTAVPVSLGVETGGALSLTQAELALIRTRDLTIGSTNAGPLTIAAPISVDVNQLNLRSGGAITQGTGAPVILTRLSSTAPFQRIGNLDVRSGNGRVFMPAANEVPGSLTIDTGGTANDFDFVNALPMKLQSISDFGVTGKVRINSAFFAGLNPTPEFDDSLEPNALIAALDRSTDFSAFDKDKEKDEDKKSGEKVISKGLNAMCRP